MNPNRTVSRRNARSLACAVALAMHASLDMNRTRADERLDAANPITARALAPRPKAGGALFEQLGAERTGIDFVLPLDLDHTRRQLYLHGFAGSGICIGDVDNDDRPDLFLVSHAGTNRLYHNASDFRFEDVTDHAGLNSPDTWGAGATFADIDNDGDLDLYVCNYDAPNALYVNRGDGTFIESAAARGIAYKGASLMASFADMDNDGDLDMFLLTNRIYAPLGQSRTPRTRKVDGKMMLEPGFEETHAVQTRRIDGEAQFFIVQAGERDHLYRNDGPGVFTEVTNAAGISGNHPGLSATWWDFDNDGWLDLYIANDYWDPDYLYRNNRDGTFTNVIEATLPHTTWFSMGADQADINNDGLIDLLVADMSSTTHYMQKISMGDMGDSKWFLESASPRQYMRNALFLNTNTHRAMEIAYLAGVANTDWTWSVKFGDLDNDGWVDLFFTNGTMNQSLNPDFAAKQALVARAGRFKHLSREQADLAQWNLYRKEPARREANLAFRNRGDLSFERAERKWGLGHVGLSHAAAYSDLDRDGDLDLVVGNLGEPIGIYRNTESAAHRVLIRLVGTADNTYGLGATVRAESESTTQVRQLTAAQGFMSSNEPLIHFGLGKDTSITRLTIDWPTGTRQVFENLPVDRYYRITEPDKRSPAQTPPPSAPQFTEVAARIGLGWSHKENTFDDFARQPLLPNKLSRLGPGLAWGDADGDGDDDLFVGGAAGQPGALFLATGDGRFAQQQDGPWNADAACEDMAVLWLDADADGDMDLYVASGGTEVERGHPLLRDRLYLNDGKGHFRKAPDTMLPDAADSTSAVVAADYDRDGDLDLFVGARVIAGRYPSPPRSRLLRNDRDRFVDVTDTAAAGLGRIGLVTGAVWSDANDDGFVDLLVTLEWGAIRYFQNTGNATLEDRTAKAGLADETGWWNGIAAADYDHDGDIDYIATNIGLNTKYHATRDRPTRLYYGDLDRSGSKRIVEAEFENDTLYPVRGLGCSSKAMPFIAQKFPDYASYARADLAEIYADGRIEDAAVYEVVQLESVMLVNNGDAQFTVKPLPRFAQASPGFGIAFADFDADGATDVFIAQNFFSAQAETGHMDGGLGAVLRGSGDGGWLPVPPADSGILAFGDGMGATVCDFNNDGLPDLVVAQNNGPLLAFRNTRPTSESAPPPLVVKLQSRPGNATAVGARVTVATSNGQRQTAELHAGSGYLSQSTSRLFFATAAPAPPARVEVRWPDGTRSTHPVARGARKMTVTQPAAQ